MLVVKVIFRNENLQISQPNMVSMLVKKGNAQRKLMRRVLQSASCVRLPLALKIVQPVNQLQSTSKTAKYITWL